jgi:hypothetical protein
MTPNLRMDQYCPIQHCRIHTAEGKKMLAMQRIMEKNRTNFKFAEEALEYGFERVLCEK